MDGFLRRWRSTACGLVALFALLVWMPTPAKAVYVDPPGVEISQAVIDFLEKNGVKLGNLSNFLNNVRRVLGNARWPTFIRKLTLAGQDASHPLWRKVIKAGPRIPPGAGFVAAEVLLGAVAVVEVAEIFYSAGHSCGTTILNALDVDGVVADQEAFNGVMELFNEALASGRWRLKPGWNGRDAMLQVMLNIKTNRCPYFADLIQPASAATFPCPKAASVERARFLRDENHRKYTQLNQQFGPGDQRTQEALSLYQCYSQQAGQ